MKNNVKNNVSGEIIFKERDYVGKPEDLLKEVDISTRKTMNKLAQKYGGLLDLSDE